MNSSPGTMASLAPAGPQRRADHERQQRVAHYVGGMPVRPVKPVAVVSQRNRCDPREQQTKQLHCELLRSKYQVDTADPAPPVRRCCPLEGEAAARPHRGWVM